MFFDKHTLTMHTWDFSFSPHQDGWFLRLQQWSRQTCDSVTCLLNWCKIILSVIHPEVTLKGCWDVKIQELADSVHLITNTRHRPHHLETQKQVTAWAWIQTHNLWILSLFSCTISLCLNRNSNPQAVDPESSLFSYTISLCLNRDSNPQAVDPESSLFSYTISLCLNILEFV